MRQHSARRFQSLTEEQRRRLRDNLFLELVCLSDASYRTLADFDPKPAA
jgi:hypothetical protein